MRERVKILKIVILFTLYLVACAKADIAKRIDGIVSKSLKQKVRFSIFIVKAEKRTLCNFSTRNRPFLSPNAISRPSTPGNIVVCHPQLTFILPVTTCLHGTGRLALRSPEFLSRFFLPFSRFRDHVRGRGVNFSTRSNPPPRSRHSHRWAWNRVENDIKQQQQQDPSQSDSIRLSLPFVHGAPPCP